MEFTHYADRLLAKRNPNRIFYLVEVIFGFELRLASGASFFNTPSWTIELFGTMVQVKTKIETPEAPAAPGLLSQAVVSNGNIYVAGQIHSTPDGKLLEVSTEEKVHQVMKNLAAILKAAGADFSNVVKVNVYVTEISELPKLNEVYKTYFTSEPLPVREAVCVKALPLGANVEISLIATKD